LPAGAFIAQSSGVAAFGAASVTWFQAVQLPYALIAVGFGCGVAVYYLVWKYIVGFLNSILGLAS
jgi:hypothetical protein